MINILFIVSLIAICGLVGSKVFERKVKKIHFISYTFAKGDERIHKLIALGVFKYNRYKKIANLFIFDFLPSYAYEKLVKMKDFVAKKYYSAGDDFRGRRILRNNGAVSFFLERLSDEKPGVKTHTPNKHA